MGYERHVLRPGQLLNDRYRLDVFLASGGMGEVWRATDVVLGRAVAVKVLLPAVLSDPSFAARFRAEARTLAAFHHPNVVDVYDFGTDSSGGDAVAYLVMAFVDGEPLSHRIATTGRLPVAETMSMVAQVAGALDAAHANGVVHRDVKPGNLLVRADGTVVLVDFGVARSEAVTAITNADAVPGTVLYMAPEQVSGQQVSPATDVYGLGAVAYHCLAGHPPFSGGAALEIAVKHLNDEVPPLPADVPEPVRALVGRALAKDPADRFPSAAALAAAALAIVGAAGTGAGAATQGAAGIATPAAATAAAVPGATTRPELEPVPVAPPGAGPARRRKAAVVAAGAGLLAIAGVTAVLAVFPLGGEPPPADTPVPTTAPASGGPSASGVARSARPPQRSASPSLPGTANTPSRGTPTGSGSQGGTSPPATQPPAGSTAPSQAGATGSTAP